MEAIIFCGIQATGKSTFYKERFFNSHVRVSMDLLKTRHREDRILEVCVKTQMPFVADNTNPTKAERAKYIELAKMNRYKVIGYFFQSRINEAIERNNQRLGKEVIPERGIRGTFARLELPSFVEGFDELYFVSLENNTFTITHWQDEI